MRKLLLALALLFFGAPCLAATAYISEFANYPGLYSAAFTPELTHQTVAIGGSSAQSNAFSSSTQLIRVECDSICSVQIGGTNPTATATSMRMAAGVPEYFIVQPGQKIAVISNT